MRIIESDLVTYLRTDPASVDSNVVQQLVDITNGIVDEVAGDVTPEPARVTAIRLEIAARAYRNPRGYVSETVDDYTWRGEPAGRSGVYLTDAERRELLAAVTPVLDPGPWAGSLPYMRSFW